MCPGVSISLAQDGQDPDVHALEPMSLRSCRTLGSLCPSPPILPFQKSPKTTAFPPVNCQPWTRPWQSLGTSGSVLPVAAPCPTPTQCHSASANPAPWRDTAVGLRQISWLPLRLGIRVAPRCCCGGLVFSEMSACDLDKQFQLQRTLA